MKKSPFLVACVISALVLVGCAEKPTPTLPPTSTPIPTITPTATATAVPIISEERAIELAMGILGRPAPEIEPVEDAHDPVAQLMLWSVYRALRGDTILVGTDLLVWVVEAEGAWTSAGIVPVESRKIYRYGVAVVKAKTGGSRAGHYSNEPLLGRYNLAPVPGLGGLCDYFSHHSLQSLVNDSPLIVKGIVTNQNRFTDDVQVTQVLKGSIPNSTITVGGGTCEAHLPPGDVVLFLYSFSGALPGYFHFNSGPRGVFLIRDGTVVPAGSRIRENMTRYQGMSEMRFLDELAEAIRAERADSS